MLKWHFIAVIQAQSYDERCLNPFMRKAALCFVFTINNLVKLKNYAKDHTAAE